VRPPQMRDAPPQQRVREESRAAELDRHGAVTEPREAVHGGGYGYAARAAAPLRAFARSRVMCTAADVSGAASTRPIVPNRHPAPIVTTRTTSGFRLSAAPMTNGWIRFWSRPFARITITSMMIAAVVPCDP